MVAPKSLGELMKKDVMVVGKTAKVKMSKKAAFVKKNEIIMKVKDKKFETVKRQAALQGEEEDQVRRVHTQGEREVVGEEQPA